MSKRNPLIFSREGGFSGVDLRIESLRFRRGIVFVLREAFCFRGGIEFWERHRVSGEALLLYDWHCSLSFFVSVWNRHCSAGFAQFLGSTPPFLIGISDLLAVHPWHFGFACRIPLAFWICLPSTLGISDLLAVHPWHFGFACRIPLAFRICLPISPGISDLPADFPWHFGLACHFPFFNSI